MNYLKGEKVLKCFFVILLLLVILSLIFIVIVSYIPDLLNKIFDIVIVISVIKNYFYVFLLILFPVVFGFLAFEIASRHKYEFDKNLKQLLFLLIMMELNLGWQIYFNVVYDKPDSEN